jgi:hypothetical protein
VRQPFRRRGTALATNQEPSDDRSTIGRSRPRVRRRRDRLTLQPPALTPPLSEGARRVAYLMLSPRGAFWIWPVFRELGQPSGDASRIEVQGLVISPAVLPGCLTRNSMRRALMSG